MPSKKQAQSSKDQGVLKVTVQEVATFDRLKNQLQQLYDEISALSKKSPDGFVNKFKLAFVNEKIEAANALLQEEFMPSKSFRVFDVDTLPSNSDVVMILSQYLDAFEAWRCAHIINESISWYWNTSDGSKIETDRPSRYSRLISLGEEG